MFKKFHGVDVHKNYATISVRDVQGEEISRINKCVNFKEYVSKLNHEDAVVIETVTNSFY